MIPNGAGPASSAEVQAEADDDERGHVDGVGQDQERERLVGDLAAVHARAPQRPRGQRDAARAAGREQARRRQPGHRDLVARAQVDARAVADEDAAEHRHVAAERADREQQRARQPPRVALRRCPCPSPRGRTAAAGRTTGTRSSRCPAARTAARACASLGRAASPRRGRPDPLRAPVGRPRGA